MEDKRLMKIARDESSIGKRRSIKKEMRRYSQKNRKTTEKRTGQNESSKKKSFD